MVIGSIRTKFHFDAPLKPSFQLRKLDGACLLRKVWLPYEGNPPAKGKCLARKVRNIECLCSSTKGRQFFLF